MKNNGILIAFDGIDGAGKTTQVQLLAEALSAAGETVLISKEPTNGTWGKLLRESAFKGRLPLDEELKYFLNDRQEHLQTKIRPALEAGNIVILDRYFYSTIAYQGILTSDIEALEKLVKLEVDQPDIAFIIDLDADIASLRISQRDGQPNEFEKVEDLRKIGAIFKKLASDDAIIAMINGGNSIEIIQNQIMDLVINGPLKEKRCAKSYGCDDPVYCAPRMNNTCEWWNINKKLKNILAKT